MGRADIFGVSLPELTTLRVNCRGHPPTGFACLTCGAANGRIAGRGSYNQLIELGAPYHQLWQVDREVRG